MLLIGRTLIGSLFLVLGVRGIMFHAGTVNYFSSLGFPAPQAMAWLAVIIEIGAGSLLIAGWKTRRAAWLLVLFVAIATATAHRFWELNDAAQYTNQLNHFLKNLAIMGALFYVIAFGPGAMSVDGRKRGSA